MEEGGRWEEEKGDGRTEKGVRKENGEGRREGEEEGRFRLVGGRIEEVGRMSGGRRKDREGFFVFFL